MTFARLLLVLPLVAAVSACTVGPSKDRDNYINNHDLSTMKAGIWIDPNGCDHWIIDNGLEGYMSTRLSPDGRPVCSGGPANTIQGDYKIGVDYM